MSISIEQVLADAKRLVERLRVHDNAADSLIQQTTGLNKRIETMTEYQEEIEEMNNIARHRPRTALILGIQRENRQIRQLQEENAELVASLKQHQAALDLIMSSYREQITRIRNAHKSEQDLLQKHSSDTNVTSEYISKIIEMAAVMQKAADCDETYCFQMEETISKLKYENSGLRELLKITKSVTESAGRQPLPKSDKTSEGEGKSQALNETVILSSPKLGVWEELKENSASEETERQQERHASPDSPHVIRKPIATTSKKNEQKVKGKDSSGAISGKRNENKNNNHSANVKSRPGNLNQNKSVSGPNKASVAERLPDGVATSTSLTNCNRETKIATKGAISDPELALESEHLSDDFDTSSLSSQSSISTVKEVDSLSISSEISDSSGDLSEKMIDFSEINVDSTHL